MNIRRVLSSRKRSPGQSIVLVGLVLLILVATTGLAVDGGNAYQNQRKLDHAASAASLAGMNYVAQNMGSGGAPKFSDQDIMNVVTKSLKSNGIDYPIFIRPGTQIKPGETGVSGVYLNQAGEILGEIGDFQGRQLPKGIWYVSVRLNYGVETYFARVAGTSEIGVNARATAGLCPLYQNLYPLAINTNNVPMSTAHGTQLTLTRSDSQTIGPFNWLVWDKADTINELQTSFSVPGNANARFTEAQPGDTPNGPHAGTIELGDWVWAIQTNGKGLQTQIRELEKLDWLVLPLFDGTSGDVVTGKDLRYHINRLGRFKLVLMEWGTGTAKLTLKYLGEATGEACETSPPPPTKTPKPPTLRGEVHIIPKYKIKSPGMDPLDIVIVQDISGSMLFGWNCSSYATSCTLPESNRRISASQPALLKFAKAMFDPVVVDGKTITSTARIAIVNFGMKLTSTAWGAKLVQPMVGTDKRALVEDKLTISKTKGNGDLYPVQGYGTPTSTGMDTAIQHLLSQPPKRPNSKGEIKDVKRVLVLFTDGMANHIHDGRTNCESSFYPGGDTEKCRDDLNWNSNRKRNEHNPPESPIGKTVALAEYAKSKGFEVFVVSAALSGVSATDLRFNLMVSSPVNTHLYDAKSAADIDIMVQKIKDVLFDQCDALEEAQRPTSPATVELRDISGTLLKTTTTDPNGFYEFKDMEPNRSYVVTIYHKNYVGKDGIARDYDYMTYEDVSQEGPYTINIEPDLGDDVRGPKVILRLNNPPHSTI